MRTFFTLVAVLLLACAGNAQEQPREAAKKPQVRNSEADNGIKKLDRAPQNSTESQEELEARKKAVQDREAAQRKQGAEGGATNARENRSDEEMAKARKEREAQYEDRRTEKDLEMARSQREEAMRRGGNSANARQRMERANGEVDRTKIDKKKVSAEHTALTSRAKEAVQGLERSIEMMNKRIAELKMEHRQLSAAGATEDDLQVIYKQVNSLASVVNAAEGELQFLLSVLKKSEQEAAQ